MTDDGGTEGCLRGEDLNAQVASGVARAEQERLLATGHDGGDNHSGFDDAVVGGDIANLGVLEHLLEDLDARLVHGLLVARGVVAAVLAQVAFLTGCIDQACDLDSLDLDAFLELVREQVVLGLRKPLSVGHGSSIDVCQSIERRHVGVGAHGVECSNNVHDDAVGVRGRRVRNLGLPGRRRCSGRPTRRR